MGSRRRIEAVAATAGPAGVAEADFFALSRKVEILAASASVRDRREEVGSARYSHGI